MKKKHILSWGALSTYIIINSMIYLYSFWSVFHINALEFATLNDLVPSILYSIAIPVVLVILFVSVLYLYFEIFKFIVKHATKLPKNTQEIDKLFSEITLFFMPINAIIGVLVVGITVSIMYSWKIGLFYATFLSLALSTFTVIKIKSSLFKEMGYYRDVFLLVITIAPFLFSIFGIMKANMILDGKNTFIVESDSPCTNDKYKSYRFISVLSDKAFAMSVEDKSLCIFKFNHLRLKPENQTSVIKVYPVHKDLL